MKIERVPISALTPDPENARFHGPDNIGAIRASLARWGQVVPILVNPQGVVIGGNGTLEAAKALGFSDLLVVRFSGPREEARALAIALNRTAELAEWDKSILESALVELAEAGILYGDLGFSDKDLDDLFPPTRAEEETFRTDAPALSVEISEEGTAPKVKPEPKEIIQYALIFDDHDQEGRFHAFLAGLKDRYPDLETEAARLDAFVREA